MAYLRRTLTAATWALAIAGSSAWPLALATNSARAGVVVVVSADSGLEQLNAAQLADIYLGRLSHLPNGTPVEPIDQKERSPAHDEFYRKFLGQSPAQIKAHWSRLIFTGRGRPPRAVGDSAAAAEVIASDPNAIGYVDESLVDHRLRVLAIE
ncbi:MAG TPA: hypothetical protein VK973_06680 [Arenicellales bacterium]|nr:hypothetical protein [Arenicellales bacterium]